MPNSRPHPPNARHLHLVPPLTAVPAPLLRPAPPPLSEAADQRWDPTLPMADELPGAASRAAIDILGLDFREPAERVAAEFVRQGRAVIGRGRLRTWAAAIVWLLAEDNGMLGRPNPTGAELAHKLGVSRATLVAKVELLRAVIGPAARTVRR